MNRLASTHRFLPSSGKWALGIFSLALSMSCPLALAIPAFPGAEGGGALSAGGRGGAVIEVTNLNDSGTGSLRAAVATVGARTVIFRVGGTITLNSSISINNPNLTIAGQTAPGNGILLKKAAGATGAFFDIFTNNVTIRFLRLRRGKTTTATGQGGGILTLWNGSGDVIVDHVSSSWTEDENMTIWSLQSTFPAPPPKDITLSWNILAEPLAQHPTNLIVGGETQTEVSQMVAIDLHHNFFATSSHRNPLLDNRRSRLVNNLIYNYDWFATGLTGGINADIIRNKYKAGPLTDPAFRRPIAWRPQTDWLGAIQNEYPSLYLEGNIGPNNTTPPASQWQLVENSGDQGFGSNNVDLSTSYQRTSPLAAQTYPITAYPAQDLEARLLGQQGVGADAGASRSIDANGYWVSSYDLTDTRIISEYFAGQGTIPTTVTYPAFATGSIDPVTYDSDRDGMPTAWENRFYFSPTSNADRNADPDGDDYTNLEEYLNGTIPVVNKLHGGELPEFMNEWQVLNGVTAAATATDVVLSVPASLTAQFKRGGVDLTLNKNYRLSFVARSSSAGAIQKVSIGTAANPDYYFTSPVSLTTSAQTFNLNFTNTKATDSNAIVTFFCGRSVAHTMRLDNVVVFERP